jgi:hypothetical protein
LHQNNFFIAPPYNDVEIMSVPLPPVEDGANSSIQSFSNNFDINVATLEVAQFLEGFILAKYPEALTPEEKNTRSFIGLFMNVVTGEKKGKHCFGFQQSKRWLALFAVLSAVPASNPLTIEQIESEWAALKC